eukprot:TRINITY_DN20773_c0_g1_i1.p1 TRINITY_DN20773_c0_g1~~TRINITY_DN20773_c0_g1_i1.p1  ORF type:complete len:418 (+),score=94.49 TRINITY_DN20773_c0_g1_i1:69-1256(+)
MHAALGLLAAAALGAHHRFGRSAAVFHGKLPRDEKVGDIDVMLFDQIIRPSLERSVLRFFSASAELVDVFIHSWREKQRNVTRLVNSQLQKLADSTGARARRLVRLDEPLSSAALRDMVPWWNHHYTQRLHGFMSLERGAAMALDAARQLGRPYDLILMMRLDLYFFRPFTFSALRVGPFYMSNRCHAIGPEVRTGPRICRELRLQECQQSVGDFWFLSSGEKIGKVFGNFTRKVGRPPKFYTPEPPPDNSSGQPYCWNPKFLKPVSLHQVVLPLLEGLGLTSSIRRHLYHGMDYEFARKGYLSPDRIRCERDHGGWLPNQPDTASSTAGTKHSICPHSFSYCVCSEDQVRETNFFCCSRGRGRQCPVRGNYSHVQCRRPKRPSPSMSQWLRQRK